MVWLVGLMRCGVVGWFNEVWLVGWFNEVWCGWLV